MKHPAEHMQPWAPVVRPSFGALRPLEIVLGGGVLPFTQVMYLYFGPEFLLVARRVATRERFQRVYYKDIQGIRLWQTPAAGVATLAMLALAALAAGSGWVFFGAGLESGASSLLGFLALAALLAIGAAVNFALGPTCALEVFTPVARVRITGVARWRHGQRFATRLAGAVRAAQGELPLLPEGELRALHTFAAPPRDPAAEVVGPANKVWHWLSYCLLGLMAVSQAGLAVLRSRSDGDFALLEGAAWALFPVYLWCAAMSIAAQRHPAFTRELRRLNNGMVLFVAVGCSIFSYFGVPGQPFALEVDWLDVLMELLAMVLCAGAIMAAGAAYLLSTLRSQS